MAKKKKQLLYLCTRCRLRKPRSEYGPNKRSASGLHYWCRECVRTDGRNRYWSSDDYRKKRLAKMRENRKVLPEHVRHGKGLKYHYKMTVDEYEQRIVAQGGRCAACSERFSRRPVVDHNHKCCSGTVTCGKCVRDLLCYRCNNAIGMALDDIERLYALITYLKKWK